MAPADPSPRRPERVRPGLWSLPVPIPGNPLGVTLVYLVESDRGPVLIDAGWHAPQAWAALQAGIEATGHDVGDCYGVLVTHYHPDHLGLAGRVREASGAWVALHPADAVFVRRHLDYIEAGAAAWRERAREMLAVAGAAGPEIDEILAGEARSRIPAPPEPDRDITDGEVMDVPGWRVRAVWAPGHSPGHTCFFVEDDDLLLSGDHLLPSITPHVGLYELDGRRDHDPLGEYLASLERIASLEPVEVLPAHEHRFAGAAERAKEILEHHDERLDEIARALESSSLTPWELAKQTSWYLGWDDLEPAMRRLALGELSAHVRRLEVAGRIRPVVGSAPVRYELVGA